MITPDSFKDSGDGVIASVLGITQPVATPSSLEPGPFEHQPALSWIGLQNYPLGEVDNTAIWFDMFDAQFFAGTFITEPSVCSTIRQPIPVILTS